MTRKKEQADVRVPSFPLPPATGGSRKKDASPGLPPISSSHISVTQIIPRKISESFGEVASSSCGGKENYLTNEEIGAIVCLVPNNPDRHSTMNPF
jgi:hypothetical protein